MRVYAHMDVDICFWLYRPIAANRVYLHASRQRILLMRVNLASLFPSPEFTAKSEFGISSLQDSGLPHTCVLIPCLLWPGSSVLIHVFSGSGFVFVLLDFTNFTNNYIWYYIVS